jgi:Predicted nucleic acid-binding protein, contains PIN domain
MKDAGTDGIREFVVDASVTLAWCFEEERSEYAKSVLHLLGRDACAYAPSIWPLEVANALLVGERRKRISPAGSNWFIQELLAFRIQVEALSVPDMTAIVVFARAYSLSVYDASYLNLAYRRTIPLATLDSNLKRAARDAGVEVL